MTFPEIDLPVTPPVEPMLAKRTRSFPADRDDLLYEPKWDGFRCLVFRAGGDVILQSRGGKPFARYFPELLDPLRDSLLDRAVVDGELIVPVTSPDGTTQLSFDALSERIHPAESRVTMLSERTPARFVAFDLLATGSRSLVEQPFRVRRDALEEAVGDAARPIHLTPATTDDSTARDWFDRFEGAGLDGVIAKPLEDPYRPGVRCLLKLKHERTADVVVAGYRMHKDGEGVGSLLLGLYTDGGELRHIGVASSFRAAQRTRLLDELAPLAADPGEHPWLDVGAGADATPSGPNRWNADKDTSWEPLRIERVAEVGFNQLDSGRLRHPAKLVRWRPDREPASCTYDQLDTAPPIELRRVLDA